MTQSKTNTFTKSNSPSPSVDITTKRSEVRIQLAKDQDFLELLDVYQNADFSKCKEIMDELEERYPEHPALQKYREELELRQTAKSLEKMGKKIEKRKKKTSGLRLMLFAIVSTLIVLVTFVFSYFYFNTQVSAKQIEVEASQLANLKEQVNHLILVGKPRPAAEILVQIRTINPEYDSLPELESRTYNLLLLENKYQAAIGQLEEGKNQETLVMFREIEEEWPGLWDVSQLIDKLEHLNHPEGE